MSGTVSACSQEFSALEHSWGAHNYQPLPVVIARGEGVWVTDVEGKRYLDFLSATRRSTRPPPPARSSRAAHEQLDRSRSPPRLPQRPARAVLRRAGATLRRHGWRLPMNTGAEAVETAIKTARKWGYEVKGVPDGQAEIIVVRRTTSTAARRPSSLLDRSR